MLKQLEGSKAIAEIVNLCRPAVVAAYPITPQTHIVENLAELRANGRASFEFLRCESEFAAASIVLGASATGVRAYTATSSQGLMLMMEVVYTIAGMRLPVVMTLANRAVSAPINIWNDQQDAFAMRDAGWITLFAESNQEAVDFHLAAFKIAAETSLPVAVNVDGFVLTHTSEPLNLPEEKQVAAYLPPYKPAAGSYLNVEAPVSLGTFVAPDYYQAVREDLQHDLLKAKKNIKTALRSLRRQFARGNDKLVEFYGAAKPRVTFVALGAVSGTIKETIDEINAAGGRAALARLKCLRPFPAEELQRVLLNTKAVAVLDRALSPGASAPLAQEVRAVLLGKTKVPVHSAVAGLGGRDITRKMIKIYYQRALKAKPAEIFL